MRALKELNIFQSSKLVKLPESIGALCGLQELILFGCSRLTALPESLGDLVRLQKPDLGVVAADSERCHVVWGHCQGYVSSTWKGAADCPCFLAIWGC